MRTSKKLSKSGNLGIRAYEKFKKLLFDRIWRPGDFVSQSELVEKTGFPISPMRDALHKLSAEGIVIITPRKGVQIIPASIKIIREAFQLRIILEKEAITFFIENAHDDLIKPIKKDHEELFKQTKSLVNHDILSKVLQEKGVHLHKDLIDFMGNDLVTKMHNINEDRIRLFRLDENFRYTRKHVNETFKNEHRDIIDAIIQRDRKTAIDKLEYHNTMALKRAMGPPYY